MVIDLAHLSGAWGIVLLVAIVWTIPWKGYALWLAARNNQPWWFIVLLLVNTLAILEIIYIFAIGRKAAQRGRGGPSNPAA